MYFVMLVGPIGTPMPLLDDAESIALFEYEDDAEEAAEKTNEQYTVYEWEY